MAPNELSHATTVGSFLQEHAVVFDPQVLTGIEEETAATVMDILKLGPEEIEDQIEEGHDYIDLIMNGTKNSRQDIEMAVRYDAVKHLGTMMHVSIYTEDRELMRIPGMAAQLQNAVNFHLGSAKSALEAFITQKPEVLQAYLDQMIAQVSQELDANVLTGKFKEDAERELEIYTYLRSKIS